MSEKMNSRQEQPSNSADEVPAAKGQPVSRLISAGLIIATVTAGAVFLGPARGNTSTESSEAIEIRTLPVATVGVSIDDSYSIEERFVGRVEAARASDLGFELPGTLVELMANDGEYVEADQVLARLDTARIEAKRDELEAALSQAEASQDLAESTYDRYELAVTKQSVSVQQLDEVREQNTAALAAVRQIRAQLEAVDVDLEKSVLKAPYAGTVSARKVDEGTIVAGGQSVLRILETEKLEIRAGLSSRAAAEVKLGDQFEWNHESGKPVVAAVSRILPHRNNRTRTVDVILAVENPTTGTSPLRDGDLIDVPVARVIDETGAWIPRSALTESSRGLWAAYVLMPTSDASNDIHRLERRQLEVVDESADRVFARGAIQDGERIVASGLHRLAPNQRVRDAGIMSEILTQN